MKRVDLHSHTNASDGSLTPTELVDLAVEKGVSALALTDHDTIDGLEEAISRAQMHKDCGVDFELIPGIEFASDYQGRDVHIVGLYINFQSEYLKRRLAHFVAGREKRNLQMLERLEKHGFPITMEELKEEFPDAIITRGHMARMMLKKGYVKSVKEAFERYIGDRCPCFVARKKISPQRAVEIIRKSGGFPVLAHPILYGFGKDRLDELVRKLKEAGLMGIEAIYSTYTPQDERDIRQLASKYDLCISGGSDFHGKAKPDIDLGTGRGSLFVSYDVLETIKLKHAALSQTEDSYRLPKILFTDLDETLLRSDKSISQYTLDVLKRWSAMGHYIALCSGRDINSTNMVVKELGLEDTNIFTIGYNGGQIYDYKAGKTLYQNVISKEDVNLWQQMAEEAGLYIQAYSDTHIIIPKYTKETQYYKRVIKTPFFESRKISDALTIGSCKCLVIELTDTEKLENFRLSTKDWAESHGFTMMYSNPFYLEVIPKDSGKGAAVRNLVDILNIPGLMSVAAGDEQNDVSMLKAADVAIAMCNGIDEIKENASMITDWDNNNDGLAKALEDIM